MSGHKEPDAKGVAELTATLSELAAKRGTTPLRLLQEYVKQAPNGPAPDDSEVLQNVLQRLQEFVSLGHTAVDAEVLTVNQSALRRLHRRGLLRLENAEVISVSTKFGWAFLLRGKA